MHSDTVSVLKIFESKLRLEVPIFQRQYVWDLEHQWTPLWEDISRKFKERLDVSLDRIDAPPHFLGAMVFDQKQVPTTHVEKRLVIDGQQRLITLQVFLSAYRDFCNEHDATSLADECNSFIFNRGLMQNPDTEKFKVWPTQLDRTDFVNVVTANSAKELRKTYPTVYKRYSRRPEPDPRMVDAYFFFHYQLAEFFLGDGSELPLAHEVPLDSRLDECLRVLKSTLQVVVIDLEQNDDPQIIFETLNSRGEPLLPADLLRNFVFMRAAHQGESQETLYKKYWKKFDDEFWRNEIRQGRNLRPRSDLFLQHYLTSRIGSDIPLKHLYTEYKVWINKSNPFKTVEAEVKTLAEQGDFFKTLISPQSDDLLGNFAKFLITFDISTVYPLLLFLGSSDLSASDWKSVSSILESYIMRRAISGLTTKNYNQIFLGLIRYLQKNSVSVDNIRSFLSGLSGDSGVWPPDDRFYESWTKEKVYRFMPSNRLQYILKRLNDMTISKKTEHVSIDSPLTIEHLMPQYWIDNWPLPDGSKGMTWEELHDSEENDPRAAATRNRDSMVGTIGNLTILTQQLNSAVSNADWAIKKPEILKFSLLPINQELYSLDEWNEREILNRGKRLFEIARKIWKSPSRK